MLPKDRKDPIKKEAKTEAAQGNLQEELVQFFKLCHGQYSLFNLSLIALINNYALELSPQEMVKNFLKDPHEIARYCLRLLKEDKQNGVSCALNLLDPSDRTELLDFLFKHYPLLGVYYAEYSECKDTMKDTVCDELAKRYSSITDVDFKNSEKKADSVFPDALFHAVRIKLLLSYHESEYQEMQDKSEPMDWTWAEKLKILINQSSLHLNFRGERIYGLAFEAIDFSTLDFTQTIFYESRYTNCNFVLGDFNQAVVHASSFLKCDFKNSKLDLAISYSEFLNCDFSQATLTMSDFANSVFYGSDVRYTILNDNALKIFQQYINDHSFRKKMQEFAAPCLALILTLQQTPTNKQKPADILLAIWLTYIEREDHYNLRVTPHARQVYQERLDGLTKEELSMLSSKFRKEVEAAMTKKPEQVSSGPLSFLKNLANTFSSKSSDQKKPKEKPGKSAP